MSKIIINGKEYSGKIYTDFVKSGSGAKAGLVPAPSTTAGNTKYLREDGTWSIPPDTDTTYSNMGAATSVAAGKAGLVPAPAAGAQTKVLTGSATWTAISDLTTSFTSNDATNPTEYTEIATVTTGEKLSSLMNKLSTSIKNIRYLMKLIGNTSLSGIGDGTVSGAISALNSNMGAVILYNATGSELNNELSILHQWIVIKSIEIEAGTYLVISSASFGKVDSSIEGSQAVTIRSQTNASIRDTAYIHGTDNNLYSACIVDRVSYSTKTTYNIQAWTAYRNNKVANISIMTIRLK